MGCKCKEKAVAAEKYSDDKHVLEKIEGLKRIPMVIGRIVIGILVSGILIVSLPFLVLFVVFNTAMGRTTRINLKRFFNKKK